jgi:hypothetical protein
MDVTEAMRAVRTVDCTSALRGGQLTRSPKLWRLSQVFASTALRVGGGGVVWELEVDGSAGEHDGGEGGLGAVEAVGPVDDESYLVVQSLMGSVGEAAVDGGGDPVSMFPYCAGCFDEFGDSAALGFGTPAVQESVRGGGVQVAGEHRAQRFLELVGPPECSTGSFDLTEGASLVGVEVAGVFQQDPAGPFVGLRDGLVRQVPGGLG